MQNLDHYTIVRELSRGGMGVVYVARQPGLDREVALKVVKGWDPAGDSIVRFEREARAVARLKHPNVIRIHAFGHHKGHPAFIMDLLGGDTIQSRLARSGPLDPTEAARLTEALARALAHAHERGVLHRDLKPANVLLAEDGAPVLMDFGLAKDLSDARESLTRTGDLMGTPAYMAPEQASGEREQIGPATDVYGLGATLYTMLVGRPPFEGQTAMNIVVRVLRDPPTPPTQLREGVPEGSVRLWLATSDCSGSLALLPSTQSRQGAEPQRSSLDLRKPLEMGNRGVAQRFRSAKPWGKRTVYAALCDLAPPGLCVESRNRGAPTNQDRTEPFQRPWRRSACAAWPSRPRIATPAPRISLTTWADSCAARSWRPAPAPAGP